MKEEDFEFYGAGRHMPCSVPVHPWERVMATQGGALVKADHQKADDAAVPTELWDRFLRFTLKEKLRWDFPTGPLASRALDLLRQRCLRWWRRRVFKDFWGWRRANVGCFRWRSAAHGESPPGWKFYLNQMRAVREVPGGLASLRVASGGLRRATGPCARGHPNFMRG